MRLAHTFNRPGMIFRPGALQRWLWLSLLLASVTAVFCFEATAQTKDSILILHSYHQGLDWTDKVSRGIQSVIAPFHNRVDLYFEYLDAKRRPAPLLPSALVRGLERKIDQLAFKVIIASDDEAYNLVRHLGTKNNFRIPVVFCGVSRFDPQAIEEQAPVTGVVKTVAHQDNLDLMRKLHPRCRKIVFLFDWAAADTGLQNTLSQLMAAVASPVDVDIWPDQALDDLPARLQGLGSDALVYMLAVNRDKTLTYLHDSEAIDLVTRWSPVPVYSPLEAYLGQGVVGGKITSGFRQGEQAGQMALRIISGEAAGSIAVMTQSPNPYMFDYRQLKKQGLKISQLPPSSVIIHEAESFWPRWGKAVALVSGAILIVAVIVLGGMTVLLKHRLVQSESKSDMENRLKERTVHLKLLNQKLKKLSRLDNLTGLNNRRHIIQRLGEEMKKSRRYETPLTIALLDMDSFKQVNTQFGYMIGDQIIRDVAGAIRRSIREIDHVGRFSGEAFLIILPNTDLDMARHPLQRIIGMIRAMEWEKGLIHITLSGGLTQFNGQTVAELMAEAENFQQQAKARGGDRFLP